MSDLQRAVQPIFSINIEQSWICHQRAFTENTAFLFLKQIYN